MTTEHEDEIDWEKSGIQANHAGRLRLQLAALDTAETIEDMDVPGYRLHPLKGRMKGRWSIWVSGNWRLTFEFKDGNAHALDYAGNVMRSHTDGSHVQVVVNGLSGSEGLLMNGPSLETSPLCRAITFDGHTVHVQIYRSHSYGWHLEVIDASGNLTGWIEEFGTDQKALDKFYRTLLEEGIGGLVGGPSRVSC